MNIIRSGQVITNVFPHNGNRQFLVVQKKKPAVQALGGSGGLPSPAPVVVPPVNP